MSLAVNGCVLRMLWKYRFSTKRHLRATWIDTRVDVFVNAGVLATGAAIAFTGHQIIDLIAGTAIGLFVIHEGLEIWRDDD